ncbi:WD40 repeat-like protein [Epithele typhae]|uniref:WD40 repeat-like protein n=1 Tax=Epithele typhae TaxID=378194 RepID=UPI002007AE2F|nr:WD40 repeat-like protein [Epithele typhae]KAH9945801.1 WD40 repeat-like protein [Epithele typhae]
MENDMTFVAPEGVYSVTEEHKPSPVAQHTIAAAPILYPTKVTAVQVRFPASKATVSPGFSQLLGGGREREGKKEKEREREKEKMLSSMPSTREQDGNSVSSSDDIDDGTPEASSTPAPDTTASTPITHDQLNSPFSHAPGAGKRKSTPRPKHNMRTTSSTFITRLQNADNLSKSLAGKQGDTTFMFYNSAKTFVWTEAGAKLKEPLARIYFSAYPTCHDVNLATVSSDRLDVIIGFHTGDILWFGQPLDACASECSDISVQGRICNAACTSIHWVPESPNLFLVSHADGTIVVYDKEREDGAFTPHEPGSAPSTSHLDGSSSSDSQGEWNPLDSIFVTMPPWHPVTVGGSAPLGSKPEKEKTAKNPVSHWRVSRRSIVDFVFSPDAKFLAAISEDGCLRVIDTVAEQLVDCYASYFGAFTCVAWSPTTGGQDDLVTIFSPWEQRVIARCQGHSSFVSGVGFDELRCDGRTYRFGSIGEDNKFILWDFSSGALHRPKLPAAHHQRMSMTSTVSLALRRRGESTLYLPNPAGESPLPRFHPAPSRNDVAVVQPVVVKHVGADLLTDLVFLPRGLLTASKLGHIRFWIRPLAVQPRHVRAQSALRRASQADVS